MSRVLLLATVLGLSSAVPAASADDVTTIGGGVSCGRWTVERTSRGVGALQYQQWVVGYLIRAAFHGDLKGVDAEAVWAWIDNYCRAHPLVTVEDATKAFVQEHPGRSP